MTSRLQIPSDNSVLLHVTHSNLKNFVSEVRFPPEITVESAKEKLWRKCGTSVNSMKLELYDNTGAKVCDLDDNFRPLGFYSPLDGYRLHVIDLDPASVTSGGWLEDTSLVDKYTISEEAYNKLDGTFRKFKEKLVTQNPSLLDNKRFKSLHILAVRNDNTDLKNMHAAFSQCLFQGRLMTENMMLAIQIPDNYMEELCTNIKVGDRCEVEPGAKRGVVKFVGRAETVAPGFWVGIQHDEPLGKHDGMVKGKRYFDCPPLHGALVRPDKVKVGDYPERDPFEEDEI